MQIGDDESGTDLDYPENFINREWNWLDFNFRVLGEGENADVPLMERLKFMAIVASNLDEFFMVRVANVKRAIREQQFFLGPDKLSPRQIFDGIVAKAHAMFARQFECIHGEILPALQKHDVSIVRLQEFTADDQSFLQSQFNEQVFPVLTPMAIDPGHPFPLLASGGMYLLFKIHPREGLVKRFFEQTDTVLIQIPSGLNRFIPLPGSEKGYRVALLDDVIRLFAETMLHGYEILGAYPFRVLRDAEMEVDEDAAEDLLAAIEVELKSRRWGPVVRLEVREDIPDDILAFFKNVLDVEDDDVYKVPSLIDIKSLFGFYELIDLPHLRDQPWPQQDHPLLSGEESVFAAVREQDAIVHVPYQKFDPVVRFVEEAAADADVLAIKMTLYRVSGNSPIVQALIRAAEKCKQVTVLVELRARFDEEANIEWAKRLDSAGAHVIYGVVGYKTHAKACLVVRRESDGIRRYVHLATGNYNDKTAKLYTDYGYLTARPEFGRDLSGFFNVITGYSLPPKFRRIAMAPTELRERFLALIEREIEKHTPETPGFIRAKMNSLIDPATIKALYKASRAGVRIDLLVRGLCRLRAGVEDLSETIRVRSILDRYLEHSRIFQFHNGGAEEVYCASADWMERNFDSRLELLFPIVDPQARKEVLAELDLGFRDNVKAWEMQPDATYKRVPKPAVKKKQQHSQYLCHKRAAQLARKKSRSKDGTFRAATRPK